MRSQLHLRVEIAVLKILASIAPDLPEEGFHLQAQAGRWRIGLAIGAVGNPPAEPAERVSPCERACLEIVRQLGTQTRHTAKQIDAAIRASGRKPWGWATITAALSNLVGLGLLINEKDKRGYALPPQLKPSKEKTHAKANAASTAKKPE